MIADVQGHYHVASDPDLWKAAEWAKETMANIRIIQTCVGPYGAIDQKGGTMYFDIGDHLVHVLGKVIPIAPRTAAEMISASQEAAK